MQDIEDYFNMVKDAGVIPLTAGGDHSITYPIMKAIGRDERWHGYIDAHCDTGGEYDDCKFHHGGPFRMAVLDQYWTRNARCKSVYVGLRKLSGSSRVRHDGFPH